MSVFDAIKTEKIAQHSRKAKSRESLYNRIEEERETSEGIYDCSVDFDLEAPLKKAVVFELTGLIESQANFLVNILLYWVFAYRIGKKERGKGHQKMSYGH